MLKTIRLKQDEHLQQIKFSKIFSIFKFGYIKHIIVQVWWDIKHWI